VPRSEQKKTPWTESASELYRQIDRRLSVKLVPTFSATRCRVVSATDPHGRILAFLGREVYQTKLKYNLEVECCYITHPVYRMSPKSILSLVDGRK
jgi:pyruvate kinase